MSEIEFTPTLVSLDGGQCEARLAFSEGALVAVFTRVPEGGAECEGWFREAGFGPCGDLFTVPPAIFATLDQARDWISEKIADHKSQS
jgi:hypothetical protein